MVICSFENAIRDSATGWTLIPRTRYVLSGGTHLRYLNDLRTQGKPEPHNRTAHFNNYLVPYCAHDLTGKTLAIYRESGLGDHLIVTALCAYLKHRWPLAKIEVYGSERSYDAWCFNQDATFTPAPPTFEALDTSRKEGTTRCDFHIVGEGWMEADLHHDQPNCYDAMYRVCGFDPDQIEAKWKVPRIYWGPEDQQAELEWLRGKPAHRYVLCHWNPSGALRMYPPPQYEEAMLRLAEHVHVVIVGDRHPAVPAPDEARLCAHPNITSYYGKTSRWRDLLPMIANAACVLCPDSSVGHVAASWSKVPVVSAWGPFSPNDRVKYYPNHHPVLNAFACPHSPCRQQYSAVPHHLCQHAEGYQGAAEKYCSALRAIPPQKVVEAVLEQLREA